ncbi:stage II sporulation protein P [Natronobacillus azotifigens]|uniref:Stage II sporulation protein P n=1 Tax=Natronobacillus azotifigens TaxID=472978 RepID=A0A9J6REN1_9BACI|nr:stage II sporulation protein P [Natronobacillus azotifigens]MCZ0704007.1 stage II sporulation protein P [Natronobacillus azotifigens]
MPKLKKMKVTNQPNQIMKICLLWAMIILFLFSFIGFISTINPTQRTSTALLSNFTSQWHDSLFLYIFAMEDTQFGLAHKDEVQPIQWTDLLFQLATNIKPNDARSLLGRELPGFYGYDQKIIVAREGTNYANLPIESSPPLEVVLEQRDATTDEEDAVTDLPDSEERESIVDDRKVVFLYNTHNRESFLPHLENAEHPNDAFHPEVNVTMVSERLKESLAVKGIGTLVDRTDFTDVLHENNWEYWQSYQASRPIIEEALATNNDLRYVFDIHRDSRRREDTTTEINGTSYASFFFVIGADFQGNEKNIALATKLHEMLEEQYPGISRGVVQMGGSGRDGVYNQNLAENAILIEFGGVDNTLSELYRSADVFAEIFSDYYWDAEAVQGNEISE